MIENLPNDSFISFSFPYDAGEFTPFRDAHYRSDVGLPLKSARARTQIMRYCLKTPLAFIETLTQTSTKHYLAHTHKFSSLLTFFLLLLSLSCDLEIFFSCRSSGQRSQKRWFIEWWIYHCPSPINNF